MSKPSKECIECGGTGKVPKMEEVYAGEPHMADVGEQPYVCTLDAPDDMDDDLTEGMALDAALDAGLPEDEAERMVSDMI